MSTTYDWSDVKRIPHDNGKLPLAPISYSSEYSNAMDLLRGIMAIEEYSERALALTADVIEMNPAHYTIWEYRLRILKAIGKEVIPRDKWLVKNGEDFDVVDNADWLNGITLDNPKNYQIWNYRQLLEPIGNKSIESRVFYLMELEVVKDIVRDDSKNFHAWSHLKWVVQRVSERYGEGGKGKDEEDTTIISDMERVFSLQGQLEFSNIFLVEDVYNNSAWSYRYFIHILWGILSKSEKINHEELFSNEIDYVKAKIELFPQNEAVWAYLIGIYENYTYKRHSLDELQSFCLRYTNDKVTSSHALELLLRIYEQQQDNKKASEALDTLEKLIPIRAGYWAYKRRLLI